MGYQCVSVPGEGGQNSEDFFVILNADIAVRAYGSLFFPTQEWWVYEEEMEQLTYYAADVSTYAEVGSFPEVESSRLIVESGHLAPFPYDKHQIAVLKGNSYVAETRAGERFQRFSAFPNDKRITDDGEGLRAGTYLTTATDATCVVSGQAAVSRYALPLEAPAIFTTQWEWGRSFEITCGSVAPNFGRSGGGVEVRIGKSPPRGGFQGRDLIPDR